MVKINIDKEKCKGCGLCLIYCPKKNLELSRDFNSQGVLYVKCKSEAVCTGCGFCYLICPEAAIKITVSNEDRKKTKKKA
jgi:2-oxoglutarate ferredoxin oxidoreductase subunit delta